MRKLSGGRFILVLAFLMGPQTDRGRAVDLLGEVDSNLLPTTDEIYQWHVSKDKLGPTFTGSPSWTNFMSIVETEMESSGVVDVIKDSYSYERQITALYYDEGQWSLKIDDEDIEVASYWAYSGSTGPEGITAPLVLYEKGMELNGLKDKIVILEVPALPLDRGPMFQESGYEFATDAEQINSNSMLSSNQWYQSNYVTRFGQFDVIVKESGAAGALVIFSMSPGRAAGLRTFPLLKPGFVGAPGLYLDKITGARVKKAAREGKEATITLLDKVEETEAYFYTGFLPGRDYGTDDDEYVFVITHADGPNLTQDNGAFGIMSVIRYMSNIPQAERRRTLAIMLDSQHFMPHRHMTDWYALHPEIVEKIVATMGIEHLGQREYVEQGDHFVQSGLPEPTLIFAQDNDFLIEEAIEAVKRFEVPRTMVQSPPRGGQGNWSGMSDVSVKRNYPGYGMSTLMSAYWSTHARIKTFDAEQFRKQVGIAVHLTGVLMTADLEEIAIAAAD